MERICFLNFLIKNSLTSVVFINNYLKRENILQLKEFDCSG